MTKSYFTLYALALELKARLEGGYIFESFSQEKNELRILVFGRNKERLSLVATAHSPHLPLYYSEDFQRKKRNTASLMPSANDKQIQAVKISDSDRILYLELEDNLSFAFQLFSADTNFFLLKDGLVQESFKQAPEKIGKPLQVEARTPILRSLERLAVDKDAFFQAINASLLLQQSKKEQEKFLTKQLIGFDLYLARELLFRARQAHSALLPDALYHAFQDLFYELLSPEPKIYSSENRIWFSLVTHTHTPFERVETFELVGDALRIYAQRMHQQEHFGKELLSLQKSLERLLQKTTEQIQAMKIHLAHHRAEQYERFGHLLLLHREQIAKGLTEIELSDVFAAGERVTIPLDPAQSALENAERYFSRAKSARQSIATTQKRLAEFEHHLSVQQALLSELKSLTTPKAFRAWREKNLEWLKKFSLLQTAQAEQVQLFRRFKISDSAELWVGKNAENNDVLTFKYARPNDIWLHARGVSGSHCVLKASRKPSKEELLRAAEIAAYYSSARTSELAPVICTEKKYVRKPKGAPPGSVVVSREEVLIVTPRLSLEET
ncbi:MAG: NFACT RNA binding domain-containing protein [Chloroherpetonaceae bacterium]|nr:NFACT RNA binding domain-containing protein [Chloroherpetonaceae bacterium]